MVMFVSRGTFGIKARSLWPRPRACAMVRAMPCHPFYATAEWRKLRAQVLGLRPYCRVCLLLGMRTVAREVDHIKPIAKGGPPLDPRNLQPVCGTHHRQKTKADELEQRLQVTGPTGAPLGHGWGGGDEESAARSA